MALSNIFMQSFISQRVSSLFKTTTFQENGRYEMQFYKTGALQCHVQYTAA